MASCNSGNVTLIHPNRHYQMTEVYLVSRCPKGESRKRNFFMSIEATLIVTILISALCAEAFVYYFKKAP